MILNGEINFFLNALGKYEGGKEILDAIYIISSDFDINFFCDDGANYMYYNFFKNGADFSFVKDNKGYYLESVFLYLQEDDYNNYIFFKNLIIGIDSESKKEDIISLLGTPCLQSHTWIKYELNEMFIHFEFNELGLKQLSIFI